MLLNSVIKEITSRFAYYMETGDDSRIPPDLENLTYTIVSVPCSVCICVGAYVYLRRQ